MANSAVQIAAPPPRQAPRSWNPFRLHGRPFFEDKNRAFWTLQTIGWAGYFVLRTLSGIATGLGTDGALQLQTRQGMRAVTSGRVVSARAA